MKLSKGKRDEGFVLVDSWFSADGAGCVGTVAASGGVATRAFTGGEEQPRAGESAVPPTAGSAADTSEGGASSGVRGIRTIHAAKAMQNALDREFEDAREALRRRALGDIRRAPIHLQDYLQQLYNTCELRRVDCSGPVSWACEVVRKVAGIDVESVVRTLTYHIGRGQEPTEELFQSVLTAHYEAAAPAPPPRPRPGSAPPVSPPSSSGVAPPPPTVSFALPDDMGSLPSAAKRPKPQTPASERVGGVAAEAPTLPHASVPHTTPMPHTPAPPVTPLPPTPGSAHESVGGTSTSSSNWVSTIVAPAEPIWAGRGAMTTQRATGSIAMSRSLRSIFEEQRPTRAVKSTYHHSLPCPVTVEQIARRINHTPGSSSESALFACSHNLLINDLLNVYAWGAWRGDQLIVAARLVQQMITAAVLSSPKLESIYPEVRLLEQESKPHDAIAAVLCHIEEAILLRDPTLPEDVLLERKWIPGETGLSYLRKLRELARPHIPDPVEADKLILKYWGYAVRTAFARKTREEPTANLEPLRFLHSFQRTGAPQLTVNELIGKIEEEQQYAVWALTPYASDLADASERAGGASGPEATTQLAEAFLGLSLDPAEDDLFYHCCNVFGMQARKSFPPRGAWNLTKLCQDGLMPPGFTDTPFFNPETRQLERIRGRWGPCPCCALTLPPFMDHKPITIAHIHSQISSEKQKWLAQNVHEGEVSYHWSWKCPRLALYCAGRVQRDQQLQSRFDACIMTDRDFAVVLKEKGTSEASRSQRG